MMAYQIITKFSGGDTYQYDRPRIDTSAVIIILWIL